ncbi:MAG: isoprenylcysteine carboxylmethyltransferase family protein [Rhizomicrobium sp.]|jgi:protein-S-isoprenylcysteine O-methyltransferase Ste14
MTPRTIALFAIGLVLMAALLFWPAGTLDWWGAWVLLGEFSIASWLIGLWLWRHDPELLRERTGGSLQKKQVFWDKVVMLFLQLAFCGWFVLMAFDAKRWQLSHVPRELGYAGAALIALSFFIQWLTFRVNSFASRVVRIQDERKQTVVTTGPYRIVRHPMYAGMLLFFVGIPLLLGSWIGFVGVPLMVGLLMIRTLIEESTLRKELAGYSEYAARVRYRFVPGVW